MAPAGLADAAGTQYEEFSNIDAPVAVAGSSSVLGEASKWIDGLVATHSSVTASYDHPRFKDFAAITEAPWGDGKISVVGTVPDRTLARSLATSLLTQRADEPFSALPTTVTVSSGVAGDGTRFWFVFNWSWEPQTLEVTSAVLDVVSGESLSDNLSLREWDVRIVRRAEKAQS